MSRIPWAPFHPSIIGGSPRSNRIAALEVRLDGVEKELRRVGSAHEALLDSVNEFYRSHHPAEPCPTCGKTDR